MSMHRAQIRLLFLCILLIPLDSHGAVIVPLRTVALTGVTAPGHPTGVNIGTIHISSLSNSGFSSVAIGLSGPGVISGTEDSRWRWHPATGLQMIVRQGVTPAPGDPGQTFATLGRLTHSAAGRNTYNADVVAGQPTGFYTDAFGSMTKILRRGDPAPGFPTGAHIWSVGAGARSTGGALAVDATVQHGSANTQMLWLRTSSGLQIVAQSGAPVPAGSNLPSGSVWESPYRYLAINDGGAVVFTAMTGRGPNTSTGGSVWVASPGSSATAVAVVGDIAPGIPGASFHSFAGGSINRHGTVVFAGLPGPVPLNFGLWTADAQNNVELRIAPDRQAPGYPDGVLMHNNTTPTINARGDILFHSLLQDGSTSRSTWWHSRSDGALREVVGLAAQAPGLPTGVVFNFIGTLGTNAAGEVFFWSRLSGPDITIFNRDTLWVWDEAEGLRLLVRQGDDIQVAPGEIRQITSLPRMDGFGSNDDGAGNRLNDLGQLAFHAGLSDGRTGAFIIAIPEPTAPGLLIMTALSLFQQRRRIRDSAAV